MIDSGVSTCNLSGVPLKLQDMFLKQNTRFWRVQDISCSEYWDTQLQGYSRIHRIADSEMRVKYFVESLSREHR